MISHVNRKTKMFQKIKVKCANFQKYKQTKANFTLMLSAEVKLCSCGLSCSMQAHRNCFDGNYLGNDNCANLGPCMY